MSTDWMRDFFQDKIGDGKSFATKAEMARFLGLPPTQATKLFNFLKGASPNYEVVLDWFTRLGGRFVAPGDKSLTRDVCFIDAKIAASGNGATLPDVQEYMAVPMVGEVGAGPGMIPQEDIESWVLVYRKHRSVLKRSDLLAVEIGKNQRSMIPTLYPQDIVLIDRNDYGQDGFQTPGNIFLVREPGQEGGGMVKRVTLEGKKEDAMLVYYSDNAAEYSPIPYHLRDFDFDLRKAIVGKVIWAWADLSRK